MADMKKSNDYNFFEKNNEKGEVQTRFKVWGAGNAEKTNFTYFENGTIQTSEEFIGYTKNGAKNFDDIDNNFEFDYTIKSHYNEKGVLIKEVKVSHIEKETIENVFYENGKIKEQKIISPEQVTTYIFDKNGNKSVTSQLEYNLHNTEVERLKEISKTSNEGYNPYESYLALKEQAEEKGLTIFLSHADNFKIPHTDETFDVDNIYAEYYRDYKKLPIFSAIGIGDGKTKTFREENSYNDDRSINSRIYISKDFYSSDTKTIKDGLGFAIARVNNQERNLRNIAEKSITDSNYLYTLNVDERDRFMEFVKKNPDIQAQPLKSTDYLAISDSFARESQREKPILDTGMNSNQLSEMAEKYYNLYQELDKKEKLEANIKTYEIVKNGTIQGEVRAENIYDKFLKDVNPIFGDIMTKKHNESEKQTKYKAESITEFYKNYVIDPTKALSHNDIYAFINQSGSNHLKEMLANQYPNITFPDKLNKASILEHIVKPIRNLNDEEVKSFKTQLETLAKNSVKKTQVKESSPNQEQKDWDKYYMDIRKNIKTEFPVSHTDIYALTNANHIPAEKKEEIVKQFVPTLSLDLSKSLPKSKLLQEIVYPLRETNKSEEFKDALKQLYAEFPEQVSRQSIEQKTEHSTNKQQSISEFYTQYLLDYDTTKNITHIPIYAYVNLPISDTEKMETLNNLARDLGRETEFVITPEELHKLSKNKVLKELVYPLRENSQSLEEVFKHQIQTSFIQSRENTQNYNIVLDNLQIDLDKTDKINIDIVNKILHEKNITISDLAENFNLNIASSSDTNLKIDFIREINKDAEKVENILHQLQNTNIKQNKL